MTGDEDRGKKGAVGRAIWRGARFQCPACGKGKLYFRYLKPVSKCATCGEDLSNIRAEDGPSWFTILLLGPLLVPFVLLAVVNGLSSSLLAPLLVAALVGGVLLVLPRVKGGFIGALWALQIVSGDDAK